MRFFSKVMRDMKMIDFGEPVRRLFTQGMVIKDGAKMSKSLGNVVSPDETVSQTGADALRLVIQFCAPPDGELEWSDQGLEGCYRFLRRLWRILYRLKTEFEYGAVPEPQEPSQIERDLRRTLHQTIRKVGQDIERMRQNTAVSAIMTLLNDLSVYLDSGAARAELIHEVLETMAQLLAPFTPHFADEMWEILGHGRPISKWPEFDPDLALEDEVQIVVQINGKVRSRFAASPQIGRAEMERLALDDVKIQQMLDGRTIRKVIVVPKKLVNIVVN
jgi:leucyl-tRNA synthetase